MEAQLEQRVKILETNCGCAYLSSTFKDLCENIVHIDNTLFLAHLNKMVLQNARILHYMMSLGQW